jgi:hypothetical protein
MQEVADFGTHSAMAGIAVDNGWVMRMGAGLSLRNLVVWRPHMTGDLGRPAKPSRRQAVGGLQSMFKMPEKVGDPAVIGGGTEPASGVREVVPQVSTKSCRSCPKGSKQLDAGERWGSNPRHPGLQLSAHADKAAAVGRSRRWW